MTRAFVLMTALPPTKGHRNLIRFAQALDVESTNVIVCTQPHEPFASERYWAVKDAAGYLCNTRVFNLHKELEQNPSSPGFWEMWDGIMRSYNFKPGDYVVSSELYGATLAKRLGGVFMPYDPNRELYYTKATNIRENLGEYFHDILPEFQPNLRTTITVFGAESTGKTTLSKALAERINGHWLFEWARPYLESVGPEINVDSMTAIWKGQRATQGHAYHLDDKPFIVQDTDLFSTVGYWEQPHWSEALGPVPEGLIEDAQYQKSDLYIITTSNIPFEADPLRYGGDHRESGDEFWIDIANKYELNYVVLDADNLDERLADAEKFALEALNTKAESIYYDRMGL